MKTNTTIQIIIVIIILTLTMHVKAQDTIVKPFDLIDTVEIVTAFAETDKFYWIGTENGLYQIKKKNNKVAHLTQQNSQLPSNMITAICAKSNGEVYIGTTSGILRYDRFAFIVVNTDNAQLGANEVTALHCDSDDQVWIGTTSSSLSMIRYITMKNYRIFSAPEKGDHIIAFEKDSQFKVVLVMSDGSRMKFDNGRLLKAGDQETAQAAN